MNNKQMESKNSNGDISELAFSSIQESEGQQQADCNSTNHSTGIATSHRSTPIRDRDVATHPQ